MSMRGRHTDAKKAEFYKQLISHEQMVSKRTCGNLDSFRTKPFIFKQTYTLSSLHGGELERAKSTQLVPKVITPSPVCRLSKAQGFSSFQFGSNQSSIEYGEFHVDPDQPRRMSLKEQREYGGAAMAGLELGTEARRRRRRMLEEAGDRASYTRTMVADATSRAAPHMLREARTTRPGLSASSPAALTFPALSRDDPTLQTLVESTNILEQRRAELRTELASVKQRLGKFKERPPSAHQLSFLPF